MWFLNGRPLRDRILTRVMREAYRGFLEIAPANHPMRDRVQKIVDRD